MEQNIQGDSRVNRLRHKMAVTMLKLFVPRRPLSVFMRSPLVCAKKKTEPTKNPESQSMPHKAPLTPYSLFVKYNAGRLKRENPGVGFRDCMKVLATEWKELPQLDKEKYQLKYKADYNEYINNMYKYYQKTKEKDPKYYNLDPVRKSVLRELKLKMGKPICPLNHFIKFAKDQALKEGKPFRIPEAIEDGKEKWNELSESERNKYIMEAKIEKEKYYENLMIWEGRMIKNGHELLVRGKSLKQAKSLGSLNPKS